MTDFAGQAEASNSYLERALAKEGPPEGKVNKVRTIMRHMFRKRTCFLISQAQESSQLRSFTSYVMNSTDYKRVVGRQLTGPMVCNLLQTYVHRLRKRAPPVIIKAFESAVAAEARRNKERLFLEYLEKMTSTETSIPTDEDSMQMDHQIYSKKCLEKFDRTMRPVLGESEVQAERKGLVERMEDNLRDLRERNFNASLESCRSLFNTLFDTSSFRVADFTNIDLKWQASIASYREKASGPCADYILAENVQLIISQCGAVIKENNIRHESQKETINRELQSATKQLLELKDLEILLRSKLSEANSKVIEQNEVKDRQVAELQANVNVRAQQAETKVRDLTREVQGLKLELEQALKEKEMMIETQRDILDKRIADTEAKYQRTLLENQKLERQLDEIREQQEHSLLEKNEVIGEMSKRLKLMENQESSSQPSRQDNLVASLREYLQDILANFSSDVAARGKNTTLVEQVSQLQSELNKLRLHEQEQRLKLVEDYEDQIAKLRQELEMETRSSAQMVNSMVSQLQNEVTELSGEIFTKSQKISMLIDRVTRLDQEKEALKKSQQLTQNQLEDQLEVIEALNRSIESLKADTDEKIEQISRLKFENVGHEDDNDILIQVISAALEYTKRQRGNLRGQLQNMHNAGNRAKVEDILSKYHVPT